MKNKFTKYSDEEIKTLLQESKSLRQVLIKLNYASNGSGGYLTFKNECKRRNLEIPNYTYWYKGNKIYHGIKRQLTNEEVFIKNSTYSRQHLKRRIIEDDLIEYKCEKCGNKGEWQNKNLVLQLEHKNRINNDNRLENLCFLCPNCHSQSKTYGGKNVKNKKGKRYCDCGEIIKTKKHNRCEKCAKLSQRKVKRPPYEQLLKEIKQTNYSAVGRKYGVSDNSIRKWIKNYEKNQY